MANEKLDALLAESAGLTDDFKASAKSIFDEAVDAKVSVLVEAKEAELKEHYNAELAEKAAALQEQVDELVDAQLVEEYGSISKHLDAYLKYVVEEFVAKHETELVEAQKRFVASQFMDKLTEAFEEFNIQEPEKVDALEAAKAKYEEELGSNYDTISRLVEERETARQEAADAKRDIKILQLVEEKGLSDLQVQKLYGLMAGHADDEAEAFMERAEFVADTLLTESAKKPEVPAAIVTEAAPVEEKVLEEEVQEVKAEAKPEVIAEDADVAAVVRALQRFYH